MTIDFNETVERLKAHGFEFKKSYLFELDNSTEIFNAALKYFSNLNGFNAIWIDVYSDVEKWLKSNENKGLFLYGNCGLGKSFIARQIIPAIFLKYHGKVVKVYDINSMNKNLDEALRNRIIVLDDIGTEEPINVYGSKRYAFAEIIDNAEKNGNIVIITTNLGKDELMFRYGERIFERIISTTNRIKFTGKSFRK